MGKQICKVSATSQPWKKNFMIQVCYVTSENKKTSVNKTI